MGPGPKSGGGEPQGFFFQPMVALCVSVRVSAEVRLSVSAGVSLSVSASGSDIGSGSRRVSVSELEWGLVSVSASVALLRIAAEIRRFALSLYGSPRK